jgi:Tol biopolymer transport system component
MLSPDGRYVAFTALDGYRKEVLIVSTSGSGISQLTINGPSSYAAWRPIAGSNR